VTATAAFEVGNTVLEYRCQEDIWGADWYPQSREVAFEALINIRPRQQNFGLEIQDSTVREQIEAIVRQLLEVE
jgi:hypothetical protein